jgi:hypothetical protein
MQDDIDDCAEKVDPSSQRLHSCSGRGHECWKLGVWTAHKRQTDRQPASQPCVMGGVVGRVAGNGEELEALGG